MTYDKGAGYIFANTMDGVAVASQDPKTIGVNRLDGKTNGRALIRELRDGERRRPVTLRVYEARRKGAGQEAVVRGGHSWMGHVCRLRRVSG
jgi:methyl-accepting chemotaxis protein